MKSLEIHLVMMGILHIYMLSGLAQCCISDPDALRYLGKVLISDLRYFTDVTGDYYLSNGNKKYVSEHKPVIWTTEYFGDFQVSIENASKGKLPDVVIEMAVNDTILEITINDIDETTIHDMEFGTVTDTHCILDMSNVKFSIPKNIASEMCKWLLNQL